MTREIIYPTFVVVLIASVWALGWEKSHTDQLEEYRPHFSQYDQELPEAIGANDPSATSVTSAFHPGDDE
jgi:hypothetical protein